MYIIFSFFHFSATSSIESEDIIQKEDYSSLNNFFLHNPDNDLSYNKETIKPTEESKASTITNKIKYDPFEQEKHKVINQPVNNAYDLLHDENTSNFAPFEHIEDGNYKKPNKTVQHGYEKNKHYHNKNSIYSSLKDTGSKQNIENIEENNSRAIKKSVMKPQNKSKNFLTLPTIFEESTDENIYKLSNIQEDSQKVNDNLNISPDLNWDKNLKNLNIFYGIKSSNPIIFDEIANQKNYEPENLTIRENIIMKPHIDTKISLNNIQRRSIHWDEYNFSDSNSESSSLEDISITTLKNTKQILTKNVKKNFLRKFISLFLRKKVDINKKQNTFNKTDKDKISFYKSFKKISIPKTKYFERDLSENDKNLYYTQNKENSLIKIKEERFHVKNKIKNLDDIKDTTAKYAERNYDLTNCKTDDITIKIKLHNILPSQNNTYHDSKTLIDAKKDIINLLNQFFEIAEYNNTLSSNDLLKLENDLVILFEIIGSYEEDVISVKASINEMKIYVEGIFDSINIELPIDIRKYTRKEKDDCYILVDKIFSLIYGTWPEYFLVSKLDIIENNFN